MKKGIIIFSIVLLCDIVAQTAIFFIRKLEEKDLSTYSAGDLVNLNTYRGLTLTAIILIGLILLYFILERNALLKTIGITLFLAFAFILSYLIRHYLL